MRCVDTDIVTSPRADTRRRSVGNPWFAMGQIVLLSLLILGPLAFGSVPAWAWASMAIGSVMGLLLWCAGSVREGRVRIATSPLYWPLLLAAILAVVQIGAGLSMDTVATREAIIKLTTCGLIFFLTQQLFASRTATLQNVASAIAVFTFALAVFAIVQFFLTPGLLYGRWRPRWGGYVFGPYVNHNHYAGLMEMLIPITLAQAGHLRDAGRTLALFTVLVAVVSVLLSGSRGGVVALMVEAALFLVVASMCTHSGRSRRTVITAGVAFAGMALACVIWLDSGKVWQRWEMAADSPQITFQSRAAMTKDTLRMARDHLTFGVGLGAFEVAYPRYQSIASDLVIDYSHNDYVQLWAEAGVMGIVLTPVTVAMFLLLAFRRLRTQLAQPGGWMQVGAAVGVCGVLVHSLSDFNLHIPANAAWMAACAAMATESPLR